MLKQKETQLHTLMCLIGGFAGTWSLLRCGSNFGAAQTANLILVVESIIGKNWNEMAWRLLGLGFYMAGIAAFTMVRLRTHWDTKKWVISIECLCLLFAGLIPEDKGFLASLYLMFFMLSAQWSVFHGTDEYNASTIFSSNNVKQFTLAASEYLLAKDKKQARKAYFFGVTLLSYHIGVALCVCSYQAVSHFAIWFCLIPVLAAAALISQPHSIKRPHPVVFSRAKLS